MAGLLVRVVLGVEGCDRRPPARRPPRGILILSAEVELKELRKVDQMERSGVEVVCRELSFEIVKVVARVYRLYVEPAHATARFSPSG